MTQPPSFHRTKSNPQVPLPTHAYLKSSRGARDAPAKLGESTLHDRHESNDPYSTSRHYQRQQRPLPQPTPPPHTSEARSTTSSQHRTLRRTPRFGATPSPQPVEPEPERERRQPRPRVAVTLGPQGQYVLASAEERPRRQPRQRQPRRQLSQDLSSEDLDDTSPRPPSQYHHPTNLSHNPPEPHPVVCISKRTHSAILDALEATLRGPSRLTPDLVEERASMSDLVGGSGPATSNGTATPSRTAAARAPVGSPSGIRGPRRIMQERAAREARQREERERNEREHAEKEARLLEESNRREEERRAAAGAGVSATGTMPSGPDTTAARRMAAAAAAASGRPATDNSARIATSSRAPASMQAQASQRPARTTQEPGAASAPGPSGTQQTSGAEARGRNNFPHAFERWETLSAHWEGLTSYWIRRLEQNAQEISQDPVSQQLARQVTDLSSAGANLFHAVVELQRLRASSERKFQRWFFETRADIERSREEQAKLEQALENERRSRADAIREALEHERGSAKTQKQIAEMRKELLISKEEARRAWEELGRREQEERDRTASLQLGQPTIVGGVQVVPMTQGVSRGNTQRDPRSYAPADAPQFTAPASGRPEYTQAPAVQPVVSSGGGGGGGASYQTPTTSVHHQGSYGSEGTYSEGEYIIDAQGNFVRDSRGNKIPFRAPASDGDSDPGVEEFETPASQPGTQYPSTSAPQPEYSSAPDYSGSGFSVPGWETLPRHHHPTRLSDVIEEEDERSRTSASQSQVSRG